MLLIVNWKNDRLFLIINLGHVAAASYETQFSLQSLEKDGQILF